MIDEKILIAHQKAVPCESTIESHSMAYGTLKLMWSEMSDVHPPPEARDVWGRESLSPQCPSWLGAGGSWHFRLPLEVRSSTKVKFSTCMCMLNIGEYPQSDKWRTSTIQQQDKESRKMHILIKHITKFMYVVQLMWSAVSESTLVHSHSY